MKTRSSNMVRICTSFLLITQTFITTTALKKISNFRDEFTIKNHRTHRRQNYIMKRTMDDGMSGNVDDLGTAYSTDYLETESNPGESLSLIVDYPNVIRDDFILLDNSVETRSRKRGNIKVEKHNQATFDIPCSCEDIARINQTIYLGEEYFPKYIDTKNCSQRLCPFSHSCKKSLYNVTVIKKIEYTNEVSQVEVPFEIKRNWVGLKIPVTIGCVCTRDYIGNN